MLFGKVERWDRLCYKYGEEILRPFEVDERGIQQLSWFRDGRMLMLEYLESQKREDGGDET